MWLVLSISISLLLVPSGLPPLRPAWLGYPLAARNPLARSRPIDSVMSSNRSSKPSELRPAQPGSLEGVPNQRAHSRRIGSGMSSNRSSRRSELRRAQRGCPEAAPNQPGHFPRIGLEISSSRLSRPSGLRSVRHGCRGAVPSPFARFRQTGLGMSLSPSSRPSGLPGIFSGCPARGLTRACRWRVGLAYSSSIHSRASRLPLRWSSQSSATTAISLQMTGVLRRSPPIYRLSATSRGMPAPIVCTSGTSAVTATGLGMYETR